MRDKKSSLPFGSHCLREPSALHAHQPQLRGYLTTGAICCSHHCWYRRQPTFNEYVAYHREFLKINVGVLRCQGNEIRKKLLTDYLPWEAQPSSSCTVKCVFNSAFIPQNLWGPCTGVSGLYWTGLSLLNGFSFFGYFSFYFASCGRLSWLNCQLSSAR